MKCAWEAFLSVLPAGMRQNVDKLGRGNLQELRLRLGAPGELVCGDKNRWLGSVVTEQDLGFIVNTASRYSPWTSGNSAAGYITAPGGHRIGICGECVVQNGVVTGFRSITSLCLRVARDFPGIAEKIRTDMGSLLILGPPGSGKTTLLRDLIRKVSQNSQICVVDERGELFPAQASYERGKKADVISGCFKHAGIDIALRSMGPEWIAVDEITSEMDCESILKAGWCGVRLIATAHAENSDDLFCRPVYQPLVKTRLFENLVIMGRDKTWYTERIKR